MALDGTEITTPPGRIVWGHPAKSRPKTDTNNRPVLGDDGKPVQQWAFGIAFDKATFQQQIWPAMAAEAGKGYPNGVPGKFSWKYIDGDGVDGNGKPYAEREGYAGCYVLSVSTELKATEIFKFNGTGYDQLPADAIKTGDYVACGLNFKVHVPTNPQHTPSLYVNPLAVEFIGYGTEIVGQGAADPNALFGGRQHQLPPGASATPVGGENQPGMPGMNQPGGQQPGMPGSMPGGMPDGAGGQQQPGYPPQQPQAAPGAPPAGYPPQQPGYPPQGQMPPPAHDFVPGGQQQPGYPPQQPQAAPGAPPAGYPAPTAPTAGMPGQPGMMPPR